MFSRLQFGGAGERGFRVALILLALAVLLPSACLLYFLSQAVESQRALARRQLGDAYRGQLRLAADRINSFWEDRAAALNQFTDKEPPTVFFEHCVLDGLADSVICLRPDGSPAYPSLAAVPDPDPTRQNTRWAAARLLEDTGRASSAAEEYRAIAAAEKDPNTTGRALQSQIRCLLKAGRKEEAIALIEDLSQTWRIAYAAGLDGRIILGDEYRLEMQLLSSGDSRLPTLSQRLFGIASNYSRPVPSAQRLFLMDYLRGFSPVRRYSQFPTYQAERIAERVLSSGHALPGDNALQLSGIGDVWKLTPKNGRLIALYTTQSVARATNGLLGPSFSLTLPGYPLPAHDEVMPVGAILAGWQLSIKSAGVSDAGAASRIATYGWVGILTIVAMATLAIIAGEMLRRQMRIAHLKTDLVAAVSHELKTPLASMQLLVDSLLSSDQQDPQRTRDYLRMIARENSRLSRLIDNFLTFSRMERNRARFQFARVQPQAIVQAAMESVGDRFPLEVHVDPDLPPLFADEDALVTVLLNLLDNAYKYTGDNRRIVLRATLTGGKVSFIVEDNGIGIAERDQKRIFRRFFQVDRTLTRKAGGVGLGLSIVEYIVKAHHGDVTVTSRPGEGSTFTVSLQPSSSAAGVAA